MVIEELLKTGDTTMIAHEITTERINKVVDAARKIRIAKMNEILNTLTEEQKQLLKDTINYGDWGDTAVTFRTENGKEELMCYGYCTNDAKKAGHFKGRKISAMFRSIYNKLCPQDGIGEYITQISDWWGDGNGDMLFIRSPFYHDFEEWAKA